MARTKNSEIGRESSVDKVEQILSGAMQEFLAHGYAGASMDRVAACAGVSKATVYSHFQDKEGLFKALIEQLARKKFNSIFGTVTLEGEPAKVLRQLGAKALDVMMNDKEHHAFMRVVVGESGRFPELAQVCVRSMTKPVLETLAKYLATHPELNVPDPEAMARIMLGTLVHFQITQEVLHGKDIVPMESDRLLDSLINLIVKSC
jgi:TetR/AcrR family transcriptional regulator, regulator of autoinduction and epiphytic fitness